MPPRHLLTMEPGPLVRGGGNTKIRGDPLVSRGPTHRDESIIFCRLPPTTLEPFPMHTHVPLGTCNTGRGAAPPQHTLLSSLSFNMPRGLCAKRQRPVRLARTQGHSPPSQRSGAAVVV